MTDASAATLAAYAESTATRPALPPLTHPRPSAERLDALIPIPAWLDPRATASIDEQAGAELLRLTQATNFADSDSVHHYLTAVALIKEQLPVHRSC